MGHELNDSFTLTEGGTQMLIVEGSDLVGKTELCKVLINRLWSEGYPVILQHFGLLPDDWDFYWDYLGFMNRRTVMDRFIMSEVVYGNVTRYGSRISPEIYCMLDAHLTLQASVTVVITATDDWMKRQCELVYEGRDEMFKPDEIVKVNAGFRDMVYKRDEPHHWSYPFNCHWDITYNICEPNAIMPSSSEGLIKHILDLFIARAEVWENLHHDV
jgi:hypothetical protein